MGSQEFFCHVPIPQIDEEDAANTTLTEQIAPKTWTEEMNAEITKLKHNACEDA